MFKKIIKHPLTSLILGLLFGIAGTDFYFNSEITQLKGNLTYCEANQIKAGIIAAPENGIGIKCIAGSNAPGCVGIAP